MRKLWGFSMQRMGQDELTDVVMCGMVLPKTTELASLTP